MMPVKQYLLRFDFRRCASYALLAALLVLIASVAMAAGHVKDRASLYTYRDTKDLVSLVEDAAALMERDGDKALKEFGQKGSKWFNDDYYIFVYALDGTCAFHPVTPDLIGKNVMSLRDMYGKPIIERITDVGRKPATDASGWVFYLWKDEMQLTPSWKSAYVRKVVAPNGQTYVLGSGSSGIKVERPFVEERVRAAAELLKSAGKDEAFKRFKDVSSEFVFLNSFIFVLSEHGHTVVDPAFPTLTGRDLSQFRDAVGFHAVREALKKLAHADEAWVQYLWPKPGSSVTSRKLLYVRKVVSGGETFIVGSDFFLPTPIWMRVEGHPAWPTNPLA